MSIFKVASRYTIYIKIVDTDFDSVVEYVCKKNPNSILVVRHGDHHLMKTCFTREEFISFFEIELCKLLGANNEVSIMALYKDTTLVSDTLVFSTAKDDLDAFIKYCPKVLLNLGYAYDYLHRVITNQYKTE